MINLIKNKPLHQFTVIIASMIIIPSIIFLIILGKNIQSELEEEAIVTNRSTSALIANNIDQLIATNNQILFGLAYSLEHHLNEDDFVKQNMEDLLADSTFISKIEILDFDGTVLMSSDEDSFYGLSRNTNELFEELILEDNDLVWSSPYIPTLDDTLVVTVGIKTESRIIFGYIDMSSLYVIERYITTEKNESLEIVVTDENGLFIISRNPLEVSRRYRFKHFDELKSNFDNGENTTFIEIDNMRSLATITETSNGWYVITYESLNSINAIEISMRSDFTILIIVIILSTTTLIIFSINSLKKYFDNMIYKMKRVTDGNLDTVINLDSLSEINEIAASFNSMTESLIQSREKLMNIALVDDLTGLRNRKYLHNYFEKYKNKYDVNFNLFCVDVEHFASINESYGIRFADECLVEIGNRLSSFENAVVVRLEGDEFVLSFKEIFTRTKCIDIVNRIKVVFSRPIIINGVNIIIKVKVGISRFPIEERDILHLITSANIALKHSKKSNNIYSFYEPEMGKGYQRQVELELSLKGAFKNEEFFAELQPIVNIETNTIERFELLSRWNHPEMGTVSPDEFIPILERSNTIHLLDLHVLEKALQYHLSLQSLFNKKYIMCVNLSVVHIKRNDFVYLISSLVERYKVDPKYIELELTESVFIDDYNLVKPKMDALIELGFKFSQDDFGDGYSSLSYLTSLNLATLKISKSFLGNLTESKNRIMVDAIVNLARNLGIEIIVEGVEDIETLEFFKQSNCKLVQGYYFYRPQSLEKIIEILKRDD